MYEIHGASMTCGPPVVLGYSYTLFMFTCIGKMGTTSYKSLGVNVSNRALQDATSFEEAIPFLSSAAHASVHATTHDG